MCDVEKSNETMMMRTRHTDVLELIDQGYNEKSVAQNSRVLNRDNDSIVDVGETLNGENKDQNNDTNEDSQKKKKQKGENSSGSSSINGLESDETEESKEEQQKNQSNGEGQRESRK